MSSEFDSIGYPLNYVNNQIRENMQNNRDREKIKCYNEIINKLNRKVDATRFAETEKVVKTLRNPML